MIYTPVIAYGNVFSYVSVYVTISPECTLVLSAVLVTITEPVVNDAFVLSVFPPVVTTVLVIVNPFCNPVETDAVSTRAHVCPGVNERPVIANV